MHDAFQTRDVIGIAHRLGKFQHPGEHHRNELAVGDPVSGDRIEGSLGIEFLHHHHRDSGCLHRQRPDRRRGVVERSRAEIHPIGLRPETDQCGHQPRRLRRRQMRQRTFDALGPAGGTRGVLQQIALNLVVDGRIRLIGNTFRVTQPAVQIIVGNQQQPGQPVGQVLAQFLQDTSRARRTDDGLRRAVVDDVGGLGGGEMGVDRHVVQTRAAGRPHGHVEVLIVLQQDRNGIALT